ncbi:hypothetical protein ABW19_dt0207160 [Dactylella cylindrospora]|nr:hypothetical protein ABW19_dt0207160 [Dactylella cylindrospora]
MKGKERAMHLPLAHLKADGTVVRGYIADSGPLDIPPVDSGSFVNTIPAWVVAEPKKFTLEYGRKYGVVESGAISREELNRIKQYAEELATKPSTSFQHYTGSSRKNPRQIPLTAPPEVHRAAENAEEENRNFWAGPSPSSWE